jgi:outer membrane protein assembly factor BamB
VTRRTPLLVVLGLSAAALAVVLALVLGGGGGTRHAGEWPAPNADLSSTRAAAGSAIDAASVSKLRVAWRFRFPTPPGFSGVFASTPIVVGGRVYLQDLDSNVYALDLATGRLLWRHRFGDPDGGPNGLGVAGGKVFGNTDRATFALDARTGTLVWKRQLADPPSGDMNIAPVVAGGLVYTSTVGLPPGGKGIVYALDAATGRIRWTFQTVPGAWADPIEAGGGGAWWPVSVDSAGKVYVGTANPYPYGGTVAHPNGGAYLGPDLFTNSLVVLDGRTGKLAWYDQVTPHDVRDYDFADSPILAGNVVYGAGKAGRVIAWNRATGRRLWQTAVGTHLNDRGPLPRQKVTVCPGLLGGVETPMALSAGRLFVPVVDLCMRGSATGYENLYKVDVAARGTGAVAALDTASGRVLWSRHFPAPAFGCTSVANDVVVVPTFDGRIYALAAATGRTVWRTRAPAGINACPAIAGDTLLVGAGAGYPKLGKTYELLAFRLG